MGAKSRAKRAGGRREVGRVLKWAREILKLSLRDLEAQLEADGQKISGSSISRFERGILDVPFQQAVTLCRHLGINMGILAEASRNSIPKTPIPAKITSKDLLEKGEALIKEGKHFQGLAYLEEVESRFHQGLEVSVEEISSSLLGQATCRKMLRHQDHAYWALRRFRDLSGIPPDLYARGLFVQVQVSHSFEDWGTADAFALLAERSLESASAETALYGFQALGYLNENRGHYSASLQHLDKALGLLPAKGREYDWCNIQIIRGFCLAKLGEAEKGLSLISIWTDIAKKANLPALECGRSS